MSLSLYLAFALLSVLHISDVLSASVDTSMSAQQFYVGKEQVTRDEAVQMCQGKSMKLVCIEDAGKNKQVVEQLKQNGVNNAIWTSAEKKPCKALWTWLDGTEVKYFNWGTSEPNGSKKTRNCIAVALKNNDGLWDDQPCTEKRGYVCESSESADASASVQLKEFHLSNHTANRDQALKECEDMSMKLASIENEEENKALYDVIHAEASISPYWISGGRKPKGEFVWLNGEPLIYTSWSSGEPNAKDNIRICMEVVIKGNALKWNDHYCSHQRKFVCEKIKLNAEAGANVTA